VIECPSFSAKSPTASWYSSLSVSPAASQRRMVSRALISSGVTPVARSITVSPPTGALSCGRNPNVIPRSIEMRPSSGESSPRMIENRVDFPAPFAPTSPMRSPRFTCREASWKSTRPEKDFEIAEMVSIFCEAGIHTIFPQSARKISILDSIPEAPATSAGHASSRSGQSKISPTSMPADPDGG
jgi:hypothetical protein